MTASNYNAPIVGRRVQVIGPGRYGSRCKGKFGEVKTCFSADSVGVLLDDIANDNSKHGYFYFTIFDLEFIKTSAPTSAANEGGKNMQKFTNFVNVAVVEFLKDDVAFRTFEYANYDPTLAVNDLCVVMSAHHGMGLAEVVEIKATPSADLYREIVSKVDTTEYNARVERRAKAAELKERMQTRAKQLQDLVLYQTLAKEDPEMQELLKAFQALHTV